MFHTKLLQGQTRRQVLRRFQRLISPGEHPNDIQMYKSSPRRSNGFSKLHAVANTNGVRTIGELTLHRKSMRWVLTENPESVKSVLNALQEALQTGEHGCSRPIRNASSWTGTGKLAGLILLAPDIPIILHGIRHLFCC